MDYILTFDYELFGSGKGCVIKDLVEPTNKILIFLAKHEVKATFFIEQLEVDAIISLKEKYPLGSKEYRDATALEKQIKEIVELGHDVQLHLHPQWYGATYNDSIWELNFDWWCFSSLPYRTSVADTPGKYDLIREGKQSLENRVGKIISGYECMAFRAGGYNVGKGKSTIDALLENGIIVDSSICPGFYANSALSRHDYTDVDVRLPFWYSIDSLSSGEGEKIEEKACLELPILTTNSSFFQKLSLARVYNTITNRKLKKIDYCGNRSAEKPYKSGAITNSNFDICLSSPSELKAFEHKVNNLSGKENNPIILVGHPKDYSCFSPMTRIIKKYLKHHRFTTIAEFVKHKRDQYN